MDVKGLLRTMVDQDASDLFLKVNNTPHLRIDGRVSSLDGARLFTMNDIKEIIADLTTKEQREEFEEKKEIDFIFDIPDLGRFRANLFMQRTTPELVLRLIKNKIQSFEELNLPSDVLKDLSLENRGLVLITGTTGSGKSTTIASILEFINQNEQKHILTVEDPIEFLFEDKKSIITQREIGIDTYSYTVALGHFMRQSPDVIFIGDIKDQETMSTALSAAESGQLVLSALHTINASGSVERIVNFFPPHQHPEVRMQLSLLLKGVVSLRLVPKKDGAGRIPACEVMLLTPTIAKLIRQGNTEQIPAFIEDGEVFGMQTFNQSLLKLCRENKITENEAKNYADNQEEFELALKGIKRTDKYKIED